MKDWHKEYIYLTNDHHEVRQGDWISDTDGVYECQEVPGKTYDGPVMVKEIIFDEEDPEKWEYGDTYAMDRFAIHRCSYQ